MKTLNTFCLFCLLTIGAMAQTRKPDLIHKKDKSIIEAIIVEIDDDQVKYKKYSSPNGPVFGAKRNDLLKVVYSNGDVEMMNGKADKPEKVSKSDKADKPDKAKKSSKSEKIAAEPKKKAKKEPKNNSDGGGMTFSVGVRGGLNLNTVSDLKAGLDPGNSVQQLLGFHGGLVIELGGKMFSVQPEILFSQIGFKIAHTAVPTDPTDENGNLKATGNTVIVPILLKAKFGSSDRLKFFVNAGPYGAYLLSSRTVFVSGSTTILDQKGEFTDNKGRIMYGVIGGGGVELGLGMAKLLIEGRYMLGLGDNSEKIAGQPNNFPRSIMASVGIVFPIGGKK